MYHDNGSSCKNLDRIRHGISENPEAESRRQLALAQNPRNPEESSHFHLQNRRNPEESSQIHPPVCWPKNLRPSLHLTLRFTTFVGRWLFSQKKTRAARARHSLPERMRTWTRCGGRSPAGVEDVGTGPQRKRSKSLSMPEQDRRPCTRQDDGSGRAPRTPVSAKKAC